MNQPKNKPLVSVIIPVYNREQYLVRTLDSVVKQDYRPLEVVVVDNGSNDSSKSLAEVYACSHKEDNLTITVACELNKGAANARNFGFRLSHGELVCFFDSDDEMSVDFVSEMSKVITSNDSELAICRTSIILDSGKKILRAYKQNATVADHILNVMINTVSFMASRELLERTGGWDGELKAWDDYELGVRLLLEAKKVEWVNREFHNVYWHKESITGDSFGRIFKDIMLCLKKINGQSLDKCAYNALYLKSMIVAGWLKREKKNDYVSELRHWAKSSIPNVNKQNRLLGAFLYHYTALGLRGAWKIAMMANN